MCGDMPTRQTVEVPPAGLRPPARLPEPPPEERAMETTKRPHANESEHQHLARNMTDLLDELRVAQAGVQIPSASCSRCWPPPC